MFYLENVSVFISLLLLDKTCNLHCTLYRKYSDYIYTGAVIAC